MTRKRLIQFVALLGIAGLAAGGAWALWLRPMEVQIVNTSHDVPIQVFGLGTVEAQVRSKIGFEAAGTLVELHADHGDSVEKGQLLARLDSREQAARVAQARANVSQAEAAVEQSAADVERAEAVLKEKRLTNERRQELMRRGTTSQQLADESEAAFDIAKADLTKAGSAVTVAKANLEQASATLAREEVRLAKHTIDPPMTASSSNGTMNSGRHSTPMRLSLPSSIPRRPGRWHISTRRALERSRLASQRRSSAARRLKYLSPPRSNGSRSKAIASTRNTVSMFAAADARSNFIWASRQRCGSPSQRCQARASSR